MRDNGYQTQHSGTGYKPRHFDNSEVGDYLPKPFTVSAILCDGSAKIIAHPVAANAQDAQDQVLMQTGGAVVIVSVFPGHMKEPKMDKQSLPGFILAGTTPEK